MPFFSVIVPLYNSAAFMRRGLDSIKEQTFNDYELILVCDSCTDDTVKIAHEYSDKVYEINVHRAGLSRNFGIEQATGEYVLFMDHDDYFLHEFAFQMLAERLNTINVDVLAFSWICKHHGYERCGPWIAAWNKAWRRSYLVDGGFHFSGLDNAEDVIFANATLAKGKWSYYDTPLYYYNFMREGSITWKVEHGELQRKTGYEEG